MMVSNNNKYIYKICTISEWEKALIKGTYLGSAIDLKDKYIHFSTSDQVEETLNIHFKDVKNLCLLEVYTDGLNIKWEKARNGAFFPHLYEVLNIKQVNAIITLKKNIRGIYSLPKLKKY